MAIFNLSGGGQPVLQAKQATPSKSQQIILPDDGYDGLSEVDIDATPLEARTVNPSTSLQTITPSSSSIGFSSVTINPMKLQSKSVTPYTVPYSVSPDSGYNGLSSVTFGKDANLTADNIVNGKSIYGVNGAAKSQFVCIYNSSSRPSNNEIVFTPALSLSTPNVINSITVFARSIGVGISMYATVYTNQNGVTIIAGQKYNMDNMTYYYNGSAYSMSSGLNIKFSFTSNNYFDLTSTDLTFNPNSDYVAIITGVV